MRVKLGTRTTVADSDRYLTFPSAAKLGDRIIAVWSDRANHYDGSTSVTRRSISSDGGHSWSAATQISAAPAGIVAAASNQRAGQIAVLEMTSGPYRGWIRTSADGTTWSAAKPVAWETTGTAWTFPCGLTWLDDGTANGRILAIAYGGGGIQVAASTDLGATWSPWSRLSSAVQVDGKGQSETTITRTAAGDYIMLTRDDPASGTPVVHVRRSSDSRTWSTPQVAYSGSGMPACSLMPDGTLIATVRDMTDDPSPESWSVAISTDHGATWVVTGISDEWMMYGQVVPVAGDTAVLIGAHQLRGISTDADVFAQTITILPPDHSLATVGRRAPVEKWLVGSFITGDVMAELHPVEGSGWSHDIGQTTITAKLAWGSGQSAALVNRIYPWQNYIAVVIDDDIVAAGPYVSDSWDADGESWTLHAKGGEAYLGRREILPVRSAQEWFVLYDAAAKDVPNWSKLYWTGTWPEIGASMARQALGWKGIDPYAKQLPRIVVPNPRPYGPVAEWRADAIDHVKLTDGLNDVSENADGVEWELRPRWAGGSPAGGQIEWVLEFGAPLISTGRMASWSHDRVSKLRVTRDGSGLTTALHMTGGRSDDRPLSVTRLGAGSVMMLETLDSSHSDISSWGDMTKRGDEMLHYLGRPRLAFDFEVPVESIGLWRPGDYALLAGDPDARLEWQARIPHLAAETRLRIVGRSADAGAGMVRVRAQHLVQEDSDAWLQAAARG